MSYAPAEEQPVDQGTTVIDRSTPPRLPIVQIRGDRPRLQLYFAIAEAVEAALISSEHIYDVRGAPVELVEEDGGKLTLAVSALGDPEGLKGRVLDLLRADVVAALDGGHDAGVEAVQRWFEAAPTFECLAYAAVGPRVQVAQPAGGFSTDASSCTPGCTPRQRELGGIHPPCCPGW